MRDVASCDFPPKRPLLSPTPKSPCGTTFHYPESQYVSTYGRTYGDVITKFSRIDSLPNFVTHGAPLRARALPLTVFNLKGSFSSHCHVSVVWQIKGGEARGGEGVVGRHMAALYSARPLLSVTVISFLMLS